MVGNDRSDPDRELPGEKAFLTFTRPTRSCQGWLGLGSQICFCSHGGISIPRFPAQLSIEEFDAGVICPQPGLMSQKIVHLVGKNQLLKLNVMLSELSNQIDRLAEGYVAVVVTMNQQNRRFPFVDR